MRRQRRIDEGRKPRRLRRDLGMRTRQVAQRGQALGQPVGVAVEAQRRLERRDADLVEPQRPFQRVFVDRGDQVLASDDEARLRPAQKLVAREGDEVRALGMSGANGVQTSLTRQSIAGQIGSILERLVALANTSVGGRYVFAGDRDTDLAYNPADLTQSPPWGPYLGAPATRQILHPTGVLFRAGLSAQEIFDHPDPGKSVFAGIEALRQALLANDENAMRAALAPLADHAAHLNAALSFYGNVQSQIAEAQDTGAKLALRLQAEVSGMEDADVTASILESQQLMFQREAALKMRGSMPRNSLFDYLG